jgi:iron complex outermembrane receptor protein
MHGRDKYLVLGLAIASGTVALSAEPPATTPEDPTELAEITVTGSRIVTTTGFTAPTPLTVMGVEEMQTLGISNVGEALNTIPSFSPTVTLSTQGFGGIGATFADLRGLGASRNLVLLDGRRVVPTNVSGNVDLNLIPSNMILRSEVVTGGASAAYGSDAVAGVTNILLDSRMNGMRAHIDGGVAEEGDAESFSMGIAGGMPFAGGRGHVVAGAEFADSNKVGDQYERDWSALEVMRIPNIAVPGEAFNILARDVHNANASVGGYIRNLLGPTGTAVPAAADPLRGNSFNPDGSLSPWIPGAYSVGSPFQVGGSGHGENVYIGAGSVNMVSPLTRFSLHTHVDYQLSDRTEAFAEATYAGAEATNPGGQFRAEAFTIRVDNPFIPDALRTELESGGYTGFVLGRNGDDFGTARTTNKRSTLRLATGLRGSVQSGMAWDAYYQYGRTESENRVANNRIGKSPTADPLYNNFAMGVDAVTGPGGEPMCRIVADAILAGTPLQPGQPGYGCQPINLLGRDNFSAEAKEWAYGTSSQDTTLQQHAFGANISREVLNLWAGPLAMAAGVEWRRDSADATADPISARDGWFVGVGQNVDATMKVAEGYVEAALPLISGAQRLDLNGAFRHARYDVSGKLFPTDGGAPTASDSDFDANTWKVGLTYQPISELRLRATRSRDIRAPNISELFGSRVRGFSTTVDHGRAENIPLALVLGGGNPGLVPETADTWTAGVVLTPDLGRHRLRVALDYYSIEIDGAIGTIGSQTIMDRCYLQGATELCPLIHRLPPQAGETLGALDYIENTLQNINQFETRGIDLETDYRVSLGWADLNLRLLGTYVIDYIIRDSAGTTERAGQTGWGVGQAAGVADLVLDGFVSLSRGPWTATLQARHIGSGINNPLQIGPDDARFADIVAQGMANPLYTSTTNDNTIGSVTYFNLNGTWDLRKAGSRPDIQLYARIANLFDRDPPLSHTINSPTNQRYFDVIGRAYKVGARVRF